MEKALNNCLASAACFCDFSEHSAAEFALKSLPYPMSEIQYRGRRAHALRNDQLEVVVTVEGGHIAGIIDLATKINPLWSPPWRSEEHTSELQSQSNLVCRLLLEKKKKKTLTSHSTNKNQKK